jgi:hypothetical protein
LNQFFLEPLHPLGILLIALLAKLPNALHKLGRIKILGHGGGRQDCRQGCWTQAAPETVRARNEAVRQSIDPGSFAAQTAVKLLVPGQSALHRG